MSVKVGIVGAGIAGLAAGIGLRRAGAEVEIFERSAFKNEVGAAISLSANALRVLDHWGFDPKKADVTIGQQMRMADPNTLEVFSRLDLTTAEAKYGFPFQHFHRADLHSAMRDLAQGPGEGIPVKIRLSAKVVDVDVEGIISLENEKVQKDLVIVADGIHSKLNKIFGSDSQRTTGWTIYRGLVPLEKVRTSKVMAPILAPDVPPGFWAPYHMPTAFFFVTYPCRNNSVLNIVLRHTNDTENKDWHTDARLEDACEAVDGYHPVMKDILHMIEPGNLKMYSLMTKDPMKQLVCGRVAIMGDSAMAVQPTYAQGACLAIEEAGALYTFFRNLGSTDVADRLLLYQELMLPRCHVNQHLTDAVPSVRDEHRIKAEKICEEQERLAQTYLKEYGGEYSGTGTGGKRLFPVDSLAFGPEMQDFFWSYNVIGEAEAMLKREQLKSV